MGYNSRSTITSLNFNQNFECFVCGDENGFRIFNSDPLKQIRKELFPNGVYYAEMLYRCNYVALVCTVGPDQRPINDKIVIWDCSLGKVVIEINVGEQVLGVRLRRDHIITIAETCTAVFSFSDIPVQLFRVKTWRNPRGLCSVSPSNDRSFLAYLSSSGIGAVEIVNLDNLERRRFQAHNHEIAALSFNFFGDLIATASEKGTLIRIFDALQLTLLREFRRGSNPAKISCINFSMDSKQICVSSNHSTIHVFKLEKSNESVRKFSRFLKGNMSSWRVRIGGNKPKNICQCAFDRNSECIIALGTDGSYYNFYFDKNAGQYYQKNYCLFIELLNNNLRNHENDTNNNNNSNNDSCGSYDNTNKRV